MKQRDIYPLTIAAIVLTSMIVLAPPARAQVPLSYPTKGQTAEQQRKDEFECHQWARQRSGYDRMPPPATGYYGDPAPRGYSRGGLFDFGGGGGGFGDLVGDAARGAALGAAGGAIAGDAAEGAAWGAFGGAIFGGLLRENRAQQDLEWERRQRARLEEQRYRMQEQQYQAHSRFNDAFGLCMEARGYHVSY